MTAIGLAYLAALKAYCEDSTLDECDIAKYFHQTGATAVDIRHYFQKIENVCSKMHKYASENSTIHFTSLMKHARVSLEEARAFMEIRKKGQNRIHRARYLSKLASIQEKKEKESSPGKSNKRSSDLNSGTNNTALPRVKRQLIPEKDLEDDSENTEDDSPVLLNLPKRATNIEKDTSSSISSTPKNSSYPIATNKLTTETPITNTATPIQGGTSVPLVQSPLNIFPGYTGFFPGYVEYGSNYGSNFGSFLGMPPGPSLDRSQTVPTPGLTPGMSVLSTRKVIAIPIEYCIVVNGKIYLRHADIPYLVAHHSVTLQ